jgi:hypothetical protein
MSMPFPDAVIRFGRTLRSAGGLFSSKAQAVAWALAFACVAMVGALLFWRAFSPSAPLALPSHLSDPQKAAQALIRRRSFTGEAGPAVPAVPSTERPSMANTRLQLEGLATGFGSAPGFALVSVDGAPARAFVHGDLLLPGVRLAHIAHQGIEIEEAGKRERLPLPASLMGGRLP